MAEDTSLQTPVFDSAKLPITCYPSDPQEFARLIASSLIFSQDIVRVIKGANGINGSDGERGEVGPSGPKGAPYDPLSRTSKIIAIPNGATYVEIPFLDIQKANFTIQSKRMIIPDDDYPIAFDPATGYLGVGSLVEDVTNGRTRLYFTYGGAAITAAPHGDFILFFTR